MLISTCDLRVAPTASDSPKPKTIDLLLDLLSKWLRRAKIPHMRAVGGFKRICKGLTEFANQLPELDPNR